MTPKLEQSLVVANDLRDQPESRFILLTGAGRPVYYAVDAWEEHVGVMCFQRIVDGKTIPVYICRKEGTWALVARDVVKVATEAEVVTFQHHDSKVQEEFYSKLDPEAWKQAQKIAEMGGLEAMLGGGGHTHGPTTGIKDDGKPTPGQYL